MNSSLRRLAAVLADRRRPHPDLPVVGPPPGRLALWAAGPMCRGRDDASLRRLRLLQSLGLLNTAGKLLRAYLAASCGHVAEARALVQRIDPGTAWGPLLAVLEAHLLALDGRLNEVGRHCATILEHHPHLRPLTEDIPHVETTEEGRPGYA